MLYTMTMTFLLIFLLGTSFSVPVRQRRKAGFGSESRENMGAYGFYGSPFNMPQGQFLPLPHSYGYGSQHLFPPQLTWKQPHQQQMQPSIIQMQIPHPPVWQSQQVPIQQQPSVGVQDPGQQDTKMAQRQIYQQQQMPSRSGKQTSLQAEKQHPITATQQQGKLKKPVEVLQQTLSHPRRHPEGTINQQQEPGPPQNNPSGQSLWIELPQNQGPKNQQQQLQNPVVYLQVQHMNQPYGLMPMRHARGSGSQEEQGGGPYFGPYYHGPMVRPPTSEELKDAEDEKATNKEKAHTESTGNDTTSVLASNSTNLEGNATDDAAPTTAFIGNASVTAINSEQGSNSTNTAANIPEQRGDSSFPKSPPNYWPRHSPNLDVNTYGSTFPKQALTPFDQRRHIPQYRGHPSIYSYGRGYPNNPKNMPFVHQQYSQQHSRTNPLIVRDKQPSYNFNHVSTIEPSRNLPAAKEGISPNLKEHTLSHKPGSFYPETSPSRSKDYMPNIRYGVRSSQTKDSFIREEHTLPASGLNLFGQKGHPLHHDNIPEGHMENIPSPWMHSPQQGSKLFHTQHFPFEGRHNVPNSLNFKRTISYPESNPSGNKESNPSHKVSVVGYENTSTTPEKNTAWQRNATLGTVHISEDNKKNIQHNDFSANHAGYTDYSFYPNGDHLAEKQGMEQNHGNPSAHDGSPFPIVKEYNRKTLNLHHQGNVQTNLEPGSFYNIQPKNPANNATALEDFPVNKRNPVYQNENQPVNEGRRGTLMHGSQFYDESPYVYNGKAPHNSPWSYDRNSYFSRNVPSGIQGKIVYPKASEWDYDRQPPNTRLNPASQSRMPDYPNENMWDQRSNHKMSNPQLFVQNTNSATPDENTWEPQTYSPNHETYLSQQYGNLPYEEPYMSPHMDYLPYPDNDLWNQRHEPLHPRETPTHEGKTWHYERYLPLPTNNPSFQKISHPYPGDISHHTRVASSDTRINSPYDEHNPWNSDTYIHAPKANAASKHLHSRHAGNSPDDKIHIPFHMEKQWDQQPSLRFFDTTLSTVNGNVKHPEYQQWDREAHSTSSANQRRDISYQDNNHLRHAPRMPCSAHKILDQRETANRNIGVGIEENIQYANDKQEGQSIDCFETDATGQTSLFLNQQERPSRGDADPNPPQNRKKLCTESIKTHAVIGKLMASYCDEIPNDEDTSTTTAVFSMNPVPSLDQTVSPLDPLDIGPTNIDDGGKKTQALIMP
ncbi:uncharacterized protein LOC122793251 [Protopterus annectens]|uniref:uncharacterized protein LOC122793251 n=1 Tax=Protopterus annectens TaxID=7888 RepID=UPI001CF93E86|nr:uncharacterized protein LOC122793251 [Protopterus annectens]